MPFVNVLPRLKLISSLNMPVSTANQLLKSLFIAVEILKCSRNFDPVLKDPCVRRTSESRFQIEIWIVLFSCHLTGMIVSPKDCWPKIGRMTKNHCPGEKNVIILLIQTVCGIFNILISIIFLLISESWD